MSKHGRIPEGWRKRGMQLPDDLDEALGREVERMGNGSVKMIGTIAVAMYLGLPADVREDLYASVLFLSGTDPNKYSTPAVWQALWAAVHSAGHSRNIDSVDWDVWFAEVTSGERSPEDPPPLDPMKQAKLGGKTTRLKSAVDSDRKPD